MKIEDLCQQVVRAMINAGYTECSAWFRYRDFYFPMITFYRDCGEDEFSLEMMVRYSEHSHTRMEKEEICEHRYYEIMAGIKRIVEFHETGKLHWSAQAKESKFPINPYYSGLLNQFLANEKFHTNTRGDIIWASKRYFSWPIQEGFADLEYVSAIQIQKYLCECHEHLKETSIHNILLYLKKLYRFLKETGYSDHDFKELLSMKVCRESKVLPAATSEDINGKKGEIKVLQRKTSLPVILPLTKDVGEALQEYILNWRPKCDYQEIFLRIRPPYRPFKDAVCIGDQYDVYCYRAGRNMVTSGVSVNTVNQVLGHTAINSAKKYISLDSKNLKECALDFTRIEVAK